MRVEKSYTRCMQHGKSHKIYRRHEPSFNNFIQHGKSYTIYVRQEKSYEFCFQRGNQTQFPLKHDFFKKFCSTPSRIFLAPEKCYCKPMSATCIKRYLSNCLVTSDVLILPKRVFSGRTFPLTDINWTENWNKVHPGLEKNGCHAMILPWSCHDDGITVMFFGMVVMIHAMITVWLPCFPCFF